MQMKLKLLCGAVLLIGLANSLNVPLGKCRLSDSACLIKEFQKGIPLFIHGSAEYNIVDHDPLVIDEIDFKLAGLSLALRDGQVKGFRNIVIDDVNWDTDKKKVELDYHVGQITMTGKYKADGKILILPIQGDGQIKIKLKNFAVKIYMNYDIIQKGDKNYVKIKDYQYDYDVKDSAHYEMTNLFNGNKELSTALLTFMNDNWRDVTQEFSRPVVDNVAKLMIKNIGKFLVKEPIESITIPE